MASIIRLTSAPERQVRVDCVEEPPAAEWGRSASYSEAGRRNGDELRQFPQILGGGGQ